MVVVTFSDIKQWEYLCHVLDKHAQGGLPASELPLAADTYIALMRAKQLPLEQNLGEAKITELGPNGVAIEVEPK